MKSVNGMLMLMIVLMGTGTAFASNASPGDSIQSRVYPRVALVKSHDELKLIYPGAEAIQLQVLITDPQGNEILRDRLDQPSGFIRPYDLSELPDGQYTVEVNDGENVVSRRVVKVSEEPAAVTAHITKMKGNDQNHFLLGIPEQGLNAVSVNIYQRDNLIYHKEVDAKQGYARIYKIEGLYPSDDVTFEVVAPNHALTTLVANR